MLGTILDGLTNAVAAEAILAAISDEALLERVKHAADENGVTPGTYVAATVRHLLDHGSEDIWLDLVGKMANSPQPGAAALHCILARAFPAPAKSGTLATPEATDNPARHRYEMMIEGKLAFVTYAHRDGHLVLQHTEVPKAIAGRGIGSMLARSVLEDVRRRGLAVVPACEFIAAFIERHPDFADVAAKPDAVP